MSLSKDDKLSLFLILIGLRDATRIDIREGMDHPTLIKAALIKIGFFFSEMKTTGTEDHLCGLAVAKKKELCEEFVQATCSQDYEKVNALTGYLAEIPISSATCLTLVKQLQDKAPELYRELLQEKMILLAA